MGDKVVLPGDLQGFFHQVLFVRLAHVGEAWPQAIVVDSDEGIVAHQIDMIFDDDDVAGAVDTGSCHLRHSETTSI